MTESEVQWELLTPPDFKKMVEQEKVCILPIGSLERHGDCFPYGVDVLSAHTVAVEAAKIEPCVVFPLYYFGNMADTSCFAGTYSLPSHLVLELLEETVNEIARNGFKKILILNSHGGNVAMIQFYMQSLMQKKLDYSVYFIPSCAFAFDEKEQEAINGIIENDAFDKKHGDHAGEWEGSIVSAIAPDAVKMQYNTHSEFVASQGTTAHLGRICTPYAWYGDYPDNAQGAPYLASEDKGKKLLKIYAEKVAKDLRLIKDDTSVPTLQAEFNARREKLDK